MKYTANGKYETDRETKIKEGVESRAKETDHYAF